MKTFLINSERKIYLSICIKYIENYFNISLNYFSLQRKKVSEKKSLVSDDVANNDSKKKLFCLKKMDSSQSNDEKTRVCYL